MTNVKLYSLFQDKNYITQSFKDRWSKTLCPESNLLIQYPVCPPYFFYNKTEDNKYAIMFVGQNTGAWEIFTTILEGMKITWNFLLNQKYASYFWNFMDHIETYINGPSTSIPRLNYYWSNLFKMADINGNMITDTYFIDEYINKIQTLTYEIDIVKPDIIVFMTGPTFDSYLNKIFNNITYDPIPGLNNILYKISAENNGMYFPKYAYKTYHPRYLYKGSGMGANIVQKICNSIKNDL